LGRVTASIPESTKNMVGSMFKKEHFRGPAVFFGIGEERSFYVEKTPSLLAERLRHNMTFFYLNYMIITGILFCLTLLVSPSAIIGIALLAGAWFWLIRASQEGSLRISSK
jgi:PRA1 family protein